MGKKLLIGILVIVVVVVFLGLLALEKPAITPKTINGGWAKHTGNPVLPPGPEGAWDFHKTDPTVLKDGDTYKMWYGTAAKDGNFTVFAYAESDDGIEWDVHRGPVLVPGPEDSWDAEYEDMETPTVIIDDEAAPEERYKMWYSAFQGPKGNPDTDLFRIGYATSPDGINWNKHKEGPVLDLGDKEKWEWDGWTVTDPMVIKNDGKYEMWYSGAGEVAEENDWHFWIGYATSADGIHWTKHEDNPVLSFSKENQFERRAVGQPSVIYDGSLYHLWYSGWDQTDAAWSSQTGYATSTDGIHWTKSEDNPVLRKGGSADWDSDQIVATTVILDGEEYKMWYTGMHLTRFWGLVVAFDIGIGLATKDKVQ